MQTTKRIFSAVFLIIFLSSFLVPVYRAQALSIPSPTSAMNQIMGDLGVDKGELRNTIATANTGRQKKQAPQVSINFFPENPTAGETVTATAQPSFFLNAPENLYFTWYLKRASCPLNGPSANPGCDLNDDGRSNIEDHKIRAARIIANGDFDWDRDGDGVPDPSIYASDTDDDGYGFDTSGLTGYSYGDDAAFGGDDQQWKNAYCFMHDAKTGNEYSLECKHLFPDENISGKRLGDGEFTEDEEKFWHTDPANTDTAGTTRVDEANVIGLGALEFKWTYQTGDLLGVAVEGTSTETTQTKDSSAKTMWALPNNKCDIGDFVEVSGASVTPGATTDTSTTTLTAYIDDVAGLDNSATTLTIDDGAGNAIDLTGWPTSGASRLIKIEDEIISYTGITGTAFTGLTRGTNGTLAVAHPNNAAIAGGTTEITTETTITANAVNETTTVSVTSMVTNVLGNSNISGPVITTTTNPLESFSMEIGDLNDCLYENLLPPSSGNAEDKIQIDLSFSPKAPMGQGNLSPADLADPSTEPLLAENTDTLFINSSLLNVEDADFMNYEWMVYGAASSDPLTWTPLSKDKLLGSTQMAGIGVKTFSFKLKFDSSLCSPQFPLPDCLPAYLKVKLTVSENKAGITTSGRASVVVPITSMKNRLRAYSARVVAGDQLDLAPTSRCENLADEPFNSRTICPVAKNEIVGMQVDNASSLKDFLWTVNGRPINYSECFYVGCDPLTQKQTDTMFFPILGDPGTQYTVNLVATDITSPTGDKINVTRIFEVVTPSVKIVSSDDDNSGNGAKPVVLGEYINTADAALPRFKDKSETAYMALQGTNVRLCPVFNVPPASFTDAAKTTWILDGQETEAEDVPPNGPPNDPRSCVKPRPQGLIFGATKEIDQSYTVGINAIYRQDENIRRMLNKYWGVQLNNFYETQLNDTIDIIVTNSLEGLTLASAKLEPGPKKFLASLSSNAPSYLNFLFRMVITTFLLLYFVKIVFSLLPRTDEA